MIRILCSPYLVPQHYKGKSVGVSYVRVVHKLLLPGWKVLEAVEIVHSKGEKAAVGASVEWSPQ